MRKSDAQQRKIESMRSEPHGNLSEISAYLASVSSRSEDGAEYAEDLRVILRDVFTSENGLKVLIFLEKAVLFAAAPNGSSESALRERNAVRNFVIDLKRIVANG